MSAKKFFETAEFKKLKKEWDKKLANTGFEDAEKNEDEYIVRPQLFDMPEEFKGSIQIGKRKLIEGVRKFQVTGETNGFDYYEFCHKILRDLDFRNEFDTMDQKRNQKSESKGLKYKKIFELHTDGLNQRAIAKILSEKEGIEMAHTTVMRVIRIVKERFLSKY